MKAHYYESIYPNFLDTPTQFYSPCNNSKNNIAKRLSFNEAFQMRDKILFSNELGSKALEINKEIMGSSPRKEINLELINTNRRIIDIDLSKQDWGDYRKYSCSGKENNNSCFIEKEKNVVLKEKKGEFENFGKRNLFLHYPTIGFEQKTNIINNNKMKMQEMENNFCYEDKENYNINYPKNSYEGLFRRK